MTVNIEELEKLVTSREIDELEKRLSARIDELESQIKKLDQRVRDTEKRLNNIAWGTRNNP